MLGTIKELRRTALRATATTLPCAMQALLRHRKDHQTQAPRAEQAEWTQRVRSRPRQSARRDCTGARGGVDPVMAVKCEVALMRFWILRGTRPKRGRTCALLLPAGQSRSGTSLAPTRSTSEGASLPTRAIMPRQRKMLTECLAIRRGLDKPRISRQRCPPLRRFTFMQDDAIKARECQEEAIAWGSFAAWKTGWARRSGLLNLGEIAERQGDDEGAKGACSNKCLVKLGRHREPGVWRVNERNLGELALRAEWICRRRRRASRVPSRSARMHKPGAARRSRGATWERPMQPEAITRRRARG